MLDFSPWIDLPLVWGILIATAVFLYVTLDGFDLGCGILFPFAPSDKCRDKIMNSIAPFWDGNETWLVLGGGGLFVAFPAAYGILLPAFYIPITLMLIGLIFRGVAFEFRFKASLKTRYVWDAVFHGGSLLAAFMQGVILGDFIQGVSVENGQFSGGALDWANGFSLLTGISLVFGYALLGASWVVMKTDKETKKWGRNAAKYSLFFVGIFMSLVTISIPFLNERIYGIWFSMPNVFYLSPLPILSIIAFVFLWISLNRNLNYKPFFLVIFLFLLNYIGFAITLFPWIVPYQLTLWEAAAAPTSQSLTLIGIAIFLPIILTYTAYSYYVFRGKTSHDPLY